MTQKDVFKELRVVDLSTVLAGPSVATFFSELGAHVLKVENRLSGGDVTRSWKLPTEDPNSDVSAYFASVNYKKDYLFLDLRSPDDRLMAKSLIMGCDVLITNFKEGDAEKFGLTYEEVRTWNPSLIYGHIGGFMTRSGRVAYDVVLQAETGFMSMNGTSVSGPLKMPVALIDVLAAHQLKEGILCALVSRATTGNGAHVQVSLEQAAISSLVNQASNYLMAGYTAGLSGSLHPNIAPYGETFDCADDRKIVLAVGSDKQFTAMCEILGKPELSKNPAFSANPERVKNRGALTEKLTPLFRSFQSKELSELFHQAQVPCGLIRTIDEVMEVAKANGMVLEEVVNGTPTARVASVAFSLKD